VIHAIGTVLDAESVTAGDESRKHRGLKPPDK
jgi:hypothetical protein